MSGGYEVEIKTLLGSPSAAEALRAGMRKLEPALKPVATSSQLNHYFEGGDPVQLAKDIGPLLSKEEAAMMEKIATEGNKLSVRSREADGAVRIVLKASLGSDSSANGVIRAELDAVVPGHSLEQLDARVLAAGYRYQAKWSRLREEYRVGDVSVCLDKNAGYGYLAEFEKVVTDAAHADAAKKDLAALMEQLGVAELPQDRLERMFAFYNAHWPEYYGTDNIFTIA